MRIAQLDLKAFGHFTNRRMVFKDTPDFHIVYGPNEAGKTTISRALYGALFGIPERTTDNYLHSNQNLRIGLVLASPTNERLAIMRRKARKNSLLPYDPETGEESGVPVTDEQLSAWMGFLSEGLYTSMFGLNHEGLVAGGKALSEGKGDLGQSLFEAGSGLASVWRLREILQEEADSLFRPHTRAATAINKAITQYTATRKEAKDAQVKPTEWSLLQQKKDAAQAAHEETKVHWQRIKARESHLERLVIVLPDVAERWILHKSLSALGRVRKLAEDASSARMTAETQLRQAEMNRRDALASRAQLQRERDSIPTPQEKLLQESASIEALYYALKEFRTARDSVLRATGTLKQADIQIESLLVSIGDARARNTLPSVTLRARIQSLATEGETLRTEREAAFQERETTRQRLSALDREMAVLGSQAVPVSVLEAIDTFDAEGNPEAKAVDLNRRIEALYADLVREAEVLAREAALTAGSVTTLVSMGTPLYAELNAFRTAREEGASMRRSLSEKIKTIENDWAAVDGEVKGLEQYSAVPTAAHLIEQRMIRDQLWKKIRSKAFPTDQEPLLVLPTAAEYEAAVGAADVLADRRFSDADRVSRYAELTKRKTQMQNAIALERVRLVSIEDEINERKRQWKIFVRKYDLPPTLGVAEMTDWLNRRDVFLKHHQTYLDLKKQAIMVDEQVRRMRSKWSNALQEAGWPPCGDTETLAQAAVRIRNVVKQADTVATRREMLVKDKKKTEEIFVSLEGKCITIENRLNDSRAHWKGAMVAIHLSEDAFFTEATARLREFGDLERALKEWNQASVTLSASQATVTQVERGIMQLCEVIGFDPGNRQADVILDQIYEQLKETKAFSQRRRTLEDRIEEIGKAIVSATQQIACAEQELERLKALAGCETLTELVDAERRSMECLRLEGELAAVEKRLVQAFALPLETVLLEVARHDLAQVKVELTQVQSELMVLASEREKRFSALEKATADVAAVDGEENAADAEQRATDIAAHLNHLVGKYASARMASTILSEVIEEYRKRYQGPLLARASDLFAIITKGRFVKIATDYNDQQQTILVGVRPTGRQEPVENLSSGTRDQLFLALRLATIESHVFQQAQMPVVADDIVIHFDDASVDATFRVLADLSKRTQVLFFTHHEHLIDRACHAVGENAFAVHRL